MDLSILEESNFSLESFNSLDSNSLLSFLDTQLYRFQNSQVPGTYVFATLEERNRIIQDFPQFNLEGEAFTVADNRDVDNLIQFNRFQSVTVPG